MVAQIELKTKAEGYLEACRQVSELIRQSGKAHAYFYRGMSMPRKTYQRRFKDGNWKPQDLIQIHKLLVQ